MYILSFDIGDLNLAYSVVDSSSGILIEWDLINCTEMALQFYYGKKTCVNTFAKCDAVSRYLETLRDRILVNVSRVVIEQQNGNNVTAQKIAQHIWTWFRCNFPTMQIDSVSARAKYKYQNKSIGLTSCPAGKSYRDRKNWSVFSAVQELQRKNQFDKINQLMSSKKGDDLADSYIQALLFVDK